MISSVNDIIGFKALRNNSLFFFIRKFELEKCRSIRNSAVTGKKSLGTTMPTFFSHSTWQFFFVDLAVITPSVSNGHDFEPYCNYRKETKEKKDLYPANVMEFDLLAILQGNRQRFVDSFVPYSSYNIQSQYICIHYSHTTHYVAIVPRWMVAGKPFSIADAFFVVASLLVYLNGHSFPFDYTTIMRIEFTYCWFHQISCVL